MLERFADRSGSRRVADFEASDYRVEDPQLLPWGYVSPPYERLEEVFTEGAGAGATGFIAPSGRADQVKNWAKLSSPVVRLDVQLDECLLLFEVLWHGEALAILSRRTDPDEIEAACRAEEVSALVDRLKPKPFAPGDEGSGPRASDR